MLVGTFRADEPWEQEARTANAVTMVVDMAAAPGPDVLALLRAMASLEPSPIADAARSTALRMRATGIDDPVWAAVVGRPELVDAWASTDELGDQTQLVANFVYPGRAPHAAVTMLDHNFNGLVRKAMLAPDAAGMRRTWEEISGMAIRPVAPPELADLWGQALQMFDLYLDPPVDDDVPRLAALIRSRLRLLPEPRPIEALETKPGVRRGLVAEFRRSDHAREIRPFAGLARTLVDYKCDYNDGDPLRWSPISVELCIADWFPRKITLDDVEIDFLPHVLRAWIRFAGEKRGLSAASITETLDAVDTFEPDYRAAMRDPGSAGPAKGLVEAMLAGGVDPTNKRALNAWLLAFNAMPQADRERILGRSRAR